MNADERRSSERAAGWCRPGGARESAVCGICGSDSCRSLSEHGRAEWRFARSAGTGGFPRRPWCGPTGARGRLGGWLWRVGAGCRGAGAFREIAQQPSPPPGQAPPAGFGTGKGTTRRKDRHRSRRIWICEIAQQPSQRKDGHRSRRTWFLRSCATTPQRKDGHKSRRTWFLRNRATTLPPGQAPPAGFDPGGGTTRGRAGTGRVGCGFCEIAQQPSRRGRLLSPGSTRVGHDPGKDRHRSRQTWFLRNCATTLPPGQAPPAGFGAAGGTTRGRTGTARGGRGFCEIAQRPSRRGRLLSLGSTRAGHDPGKDGHWSRRTGFLRNCATTLPPGQAPLAGFEPGRGTTRGRTGTGRGGRGFCEIAQQPSRRGQAPLARFGADGGTTPGKGRHSSRQTWFLRNCATTLPPGQAPPAARRGQVFAKCATTLGSGAPRVYATQQSGTGLAAATTGLGLWGRAPSPSSLRASTSPAKRGRGEYGSR